MLKPGAQTIEASAYEVIVTDDSKEGLAQQLIQEKYIWATWVKGPTKGPAANRNNGAKYAKGEWLVFIDDDCEPGTDLIKTYSHAIINYKEVRVFEGYINVDRPQRNFMEESPINTTGGHLWSCNFMIKKDIFLKTLEGFDEKYPFAAMEDVDLYYRLKKLGETVEFLQNACVIHPWRLQNRPVDLGKKRFASLLYFLKKYPEKRKKYNAAYFFKAFLNMGSGLLKNAVGFRFRGFSKRIIVMFMQLYFALRVSLKKHSNILQKNTAN